MTAVTSGQKREFFDAKGFPLIGDSVVLFQIDELPALVSNLVRGKVAWSDVETKYGLFEGQETGAK